MAERVLLVATLLVAALLPVALASVAFAAATSSRARADWGILRGSDRDARQLVVTDLLFSLGDLLGGDRENARRTAVISDERDSNGVVVQRGRAGDDRVRGVVLESTHARLHDQLEDGLVATRDELGSHGQRETRVQRGEHRRVVVFIVPRDGEQATHDVEREAKPFHVDEEFGRNGEVLRGETAQAESALCRCDVQGDDIVPIVDRLWGVSLVGDRPFSCQEVLDDLLWQKRGYRLVGQAGRVDGDLRVEDALEDDYAPGCSPASIETKRSEGS